MGGKTDVAKGRIKEAAGVLTGNDKRRAEGQADQTAGKVVDKVKQAVKKLRDSRPSQCANAIGSRC